MRQVPLGSRKLSQALLPFGLQPASDKTIVGINRSVTSLRALRLVSRPLNLPLQLCESEILIALELLSGSQRRFDACRSKRLEKCGRHRFLDLAAAHAHAPLAPAVHDVCARAIVCRGGAPPVVRDAQSAPAASALGDALQERCSLSHGSSRLVRAGMRVAGEPLLIGLERVPIDEALVMIAKKDGPLMAWP